MTLPVRTEHRGIHRRAERGGGGRLFYDLSCLLAPHTVPGHTGSPAPPPTAILPIHSPWGRRTGSPRGTDSGGSSSGGGSSSCGGGSSACSSRVEAAACLFLLSPSSLLLLSSLLFPLFFLFPTLADVTSLQKPFDMEENISAFLRLQRASRLLLCPPCQGGPRGPHGKGGHSQGAWGGHYLLLPFSLSMVYSFTFVSLDFFFFTFLLYIYSKLS